MRGEAIGLSDASSVTTHKSNLQKSRADTPSHSRGTFAPGLCRKIVPPPKQRAQGEPDARQAPVSPRAKRLRESAKITGEGGINRPSLRNGFNGLLRALLGEPDFVVTVARAMRKAHRRDLSASHGAPGPHDFAVRAYAARRSAPSRPSHSNPRLVTTAIRPSCGSEQNKNIKKVVRGVNRKMPAAAVLESMAKGQRVDISRATFLSRTVAW